MDRGEVKETVTLLLKKYRWAVLVLAVGLLLMAAPETGEDLQGTAAQKNEEVQITLQQELEELLSRLDGAGKVKVLLSQASGAQSYYQTDDDLSRTGDTADQRKETVIITSSDREESGLLQRVDPPKYLGAVVLCQGADSPSIKLAVVDAVATATGLGTNKISVLKMK